MKTVLITGADSYIGTSFESYVKVHYQKEISTRAIDMVDGSWRHQDFSSYDTVFHVAGIAHADTGRVSEERKALYYAVNSNLAVETAAKSKKEGVKQFIYMSSAIVYGDSAPYGKRRRIKKSTKPSPANFYGDSKWRGDKGVRRLQDNSFAVTVIRAPMIYGKNSKGNYPLLAKMAKTLPVFPYVNNERSMLYIENLCEFLCQIILRGEGGVFWPQNGEYSRTSDVVKLIAEANGHRLYLLRLLKWAVMLSSKMPGKIGRMVNKAFGNMSYDQSMSEYDFEYRVADLRSSIMKTERP